MADTPPQPSVHYHEATRAPAWVVVAGVTLAIAPLVGLAAALRDPDLSPAGRAAVAASMALASVALLWLALFGMTVRVEVDRDQVRFRLGPFSRTLRISEIESAAAEAYRWWAFGGWGWRFGWGRDRHGRRDQAYTVPFLRSGVAVASSKGRYYLSSRTPERLAEAIRGVTGESPDGHKQEGRP